MIRFLEAVFSKTMRAYWWGAMHSGQRFGLTQVQALIASEIKVLQKSKQNPKAVNERIAELDYIQALIRKLITDAK